jgi:hypothetical protein
MLQPALHLREHPETDSIMSSSTSFTFSQGTQVPLPSFSSPPPNNNDGGGGSSTMTQGANYFFGFLITFVVLLLVFVACGVGSRRRYLYSRRAVLMQDELEWGSSRRTARLPPPVFWDAWLDKGATDDDPHWSSILVCHFRLDIYFFQPLSAEVKISSALVSYDDTKRIF